MLKAHLIALIKIKQHAEKKIMNVTFEKNAFLNTLNSENACTVFFFQHDSPTVPKSTKRKKCEKKFSVFLVCKQIVLKNYSVEVASCLTFHIV